jgi:hypothetical protein
VCWIDRIRLFERQTANGKWQKKKRLAFGEPFLFVLGIPYHTGMIE